MKRLDAVREAYARTGTKHDFYDGMITGTTLSGKIICRIVWGMSSAENDRYIEQALSGIPRDFTGTLLEVPVGTGVLTMPLYRDLPEASVTCLDYSAEMLSRAEARAARFGLRNVRFCRGDVGKLPFADETFDAVLSLNGFHAFPDKNAAYRETYRVLKPGGIFCGCFYIKDEVKRADRIVNAIYVKRGYFTPPFETLESLTERLGHRYETANVRHVKSMATFVCRKAKGDGCRERNRQ